MDNRTSAAQHSTNESKIARRREHERFRLSLSSELLRQAHPRPLGELFDTHPSGAAKRSEVLRIILGEGEPLALARLAVFVGDLEGVKIVGTAADGREAAEAIKRLKPDLVILDVQMPEQNGLGVAAGVPDEHRPEIIFVAAHEQYALDAFEVDAADYLLKPVRFERLRQAVERARRRKYLRYMAAIAESADIRAQNLEASTEHEYGIWVPNREGAVFVPYEIIDWIEAQRDYVMLHTRARSYLLRLSMRALEQKLKGTKLMRVHRSAFVRIAQVVEVQGLGKKVNGVVLSSGAKVSVGPNYSAALAKRLSI